MNCCAPKAAMPVGWAMTPLLTAGFPNPPPDVANGLLAPKAPPPAELPVMLGMRDWRNGLLPVVWGCSGAANVGSVVALRCGANGEGAPVNDLEGGEETLLARGGKAPKLAECDRPWLGGGAKGEFGPGLAPFAPAPGVPGPLTPFAAPLAPGLTRPGDAAGDDVNCPPCWKGNPVLCGCRLEGDAEGSAIGGSDSISDLPKDEVGWNGLTVLPPNPVFWGWRNSALPAVFDGLPKFRSPKDESRSLFCPDCWGLSTAKALAMSDMPVPLDDGPRGSHGEEVDCCREGGWGWDD